MRKTDVLKTYRKSKFLGNKTWRNVLALKSKKIEGILGETFILALLSSAVFLLQNGVRFFQISFVREIKGFYQIFLGNEVDFSDIINVSPNILAKNWNFKKLRHRCVDERALITTILISSCHWKTLAPLLLLKEKTWKHIFNPNSELSRNCTEEQIMPSKTTINWRFSKNSCKGLLYP